MIQSTDGTFFIYYTVSHNETASAVLQLYETEILVEAIKFSTLGVAHTEETCFKQFVSCNMKLFCQFLWCLCCLRLSSIFVCALSE